MTKVKKFVEGLTQINIQNQINGKLISISICWCFKKTVIYQDIVVNIMEMRLFKFLSEFCGSVNEFDDIVILSGIEFHLRIRFHLLMNFQIQSVTAVWFSWEWLSP